MAALNSVQMVLASQAGYIHNFQSEFIQEARKIAKRGEDWRLLVRRPAGRPPLLLNRESLDFLLDKRVLKKASGYENIYIEITEASAGFEIACHLIELFCNAKEGLESVAKVVPNGEVVNDPKKTIEFDSRGLNFVLKVNSSLDGFEEIAEKTIQDLLDAFDKVEAYFKARWRKPSGITRKELNPVTLASTDPRTAYGNKYR
ncbi:hypothetical protein [Pseudomonas sp.]|uniref:hypothetical protein n=1 Tax=Pseudomonas sp. TaxID=306 RepID=UPI003241EC55